MKALYTSAVLAITILCAGKLHAQVDVNDSLALVDLYNSTDGPHWINNNDWLSVKPVGEWYGIYTSSDGTEVTYIFLNDNKLTGVLPESFGNLKNVSQFDLYNNKLSGAIPDSAGNLEAAYELNLRNNVLSGVIPASLSKLEHLNKLDLSNNQLSGNIPPELGMLKNLTSLNLENNKLEGSIPSSFGKLKALYSLILNNNKLSDSIPSELGKTNMVYLNLSHNQLSGSIPAALGDIRGLGYLYLNNNQLSGNIPTTLGKISEYRFSEIDLSYNQLSGSVPISLSDNGRFLIYYLLYLNNNNLSGSLPKDFGNGYGFTYLNLSFNQLSGDIPSPINTSDSLNLSHNFFSGKIPSTLFTIDGPKYLDLSYNELEGEIPDTKSSDYHHLTNIDLSHNKIHGNIPAGMRWFGYLTDLNLSSNLLSDTIPSALGSLEQIKFLSVFHNRLTGNIPSSFSNLKKLRRLNVGGNRLRGVLPSFLTTLPDLFKLNVINNHFTFDGMEALVQHNFDSLLYFREYALTVHQSGNTVSVYAGGTLSNNTYKWYNDGNLVVTINGDSTYTPTANGNYYVNVTNSVATELTLFSDTVSFSGGKISDAIAASLTSINNFSVYPNPAKTFTTVSFNASGNVVVRLNDVNGNLLQTKNIVAAKGVNTAKLNISGYANGIYFITLIDDKKQAQTLKLQKQ